MQISVVFEEILGFISRGGGSDLRGCVSFQIFVLYFSCVESDKVHQEKLKEGLFRKLLGSYSRFRVCLFKVKLEIEVLFVWPDLGFNL